MEVTMSIKISFEVQKKIDETMWEIKASPHELGMFGKPHGTQNGPSVLFIENAKFIQNQNRIECQAMDISVVNIGTTEMAIAFSIPHKGTSDIGLKGSLIESTNEFDSVKKRKSYKYMDNNRFSGDKEFKNRLEKSTPELRKIGIDLLAEIRKHYHGNLVHKPPRFVESPENFWTVTVQDKRTKSLRITIYGKPEDFIQPKDIKIKKDRGSYSNFVIENYEQLPSAKKIILEAMNLKRNR